MAAQPTVDKAFAGYLAQDEVNYVPLSATDGKACANCRWFLAHGGCFIVQGDKPEPILATGYCDRWETPPAPAAEPAEAIVEAVEEMAEAIVESTMPMYTEMERKPLTLGERFKRLFTRRKVQAPFEIIKSTDGTLLWHAIYSNNFEDLEGEILTAKGFDNYIDRLDMGLIPMPSLQAWHTPGSEHGQADIVFRVGHFVHAIGHFFDTPLAAKAISYYRKNAGKLKMSHGFYAPEWAFDGKHYLDFNTIEITTLPPYAAANPYTSFEELTAMTLNPDKQKYLEELFGKDGAAALIQTDEEYGKALEQMRIAFKEMAQTQPETPAAAAADAEPTALKSLYADISTNLKELYEALLVQGKVLVGKDAEIKALQTKYDGEITSLQKELDEVRTVINAPPRRPAHDSSTVRKDGEDLKNVIPADDPTTGFWSGMGVVIKPEGT